MGVIVSSLIAHSADADIYLFPLVCNFGSQVLAYTNDRACLGMQKMIAAVHITRSNP